MLTILEESSCSPEELGKRIGVSGMTLRRWLKKPGGTKVPKVYVPAIRDACLEMAAEGRLDPEGPVVRMLLSEAPPGEYHVALKNLGLRQGFALAPSGSEDQILTGLAQIGQQTEKQAEVEGHSDRVLWFKNLGEEWSDRISFLWKVIRSKKLASPDKVVAYGALFYLLTPLDFIPDHIPFFGFLDDLGVLGIAVAYYSKRMGNVI